MPLTTAYLFLALVSSLAGVSFFLFCLSLFRHPQVTEELPFIIDITHGICPKCGDDRDLVVETLEVQSNGFWHQFSCKCCGFKAKAHLRDAA
jgi:hypothetical protein